MQRSPGDRIGERAIRRRHRVQRPVRLDVPQADAFALRNRRQRADLVEDHVLDLPRRHRQLPPPESRKVDANQWMLVGEGNHRGLEISDRRAKAMDEHEPCASVGKGPCRKAGVNGNAVHDIVNGDKRLSRRNSGGHRSTIPRMRAGCIRRSSLIMCHTSSGPQQFRRLRR